MPGSESVSLNVSSLTTYQNLVDFANKVPEGHQVRAEPLKHGVVMLYSKPESNSNALSRLATSDKERQGKFDLSRKTIANVVSRTQSISHADAMSKLGFSDQQGKKQFKEGDMTSALQKVSTEIRA